MSLPLEGVRVVEYAQYVAGPLCGVLLADLGADVIKVEPPAGDAYRFVMPVRPGSAATSSRSIAGSARSWSTSRPRTGSHQRTAARPADIVVHNFPPERAPVSGSSGMFYTPHTPRSWSVG